MTSPFSGHVTVGTNVTNHDPEVLWRNISVPPLHAAMVSFRQNLVDEIDVQLFRHVHPRHSPCAGHCREQRTLLWSRAEQRSDFAHVYHASALSLEVRKKGGPLPGHFRLFFSFFPEGEAPRKLSRGFWNCCVSLYPRFQHHLACNLRTECEDGRDETGRCPFSSARCGGLVALCGRCYRVIPKLLDCDVTETSDCRYTGDRHDYEWARGRCQSLGGLLGVPHCVLGWLDTLQGLAKVHQSRLHNLWVGLYTADPALPSMYTYEIVSEDNTVLYHSLRCMENFIYRKKECFYSENYHASRDCYFHLSYGAVCEFSTNVTVNSSDPPVSISLTGTRFLPPADDHSTTLCREGHAVRTFLLCGSHLYAACGQQRTPCVVSDHTDHVFSGSGSHAPGGQLTALATFTCREDVRTVISYTLVCDFIADCRGESDESFCTHPPCSRTFLCSSGQCVDYHQVCDRIKHCVDHSDEADCPRPRALTIPRYFFPSPAVVRFDGVLHFESSPLSSNESCPDSHYRCPGDFDDCLPVYTRCNGMHDCIGHQDEHGCAEAKCPGFFQCRLSTVCFHGDHLCDGWPHCPLRDDELVCHVACPGGCECQGHTFLCHRPFSVALFPHLRSLDATASSMTPCDVSANLYLVHLVLVRCALLLLPRMTLMNLRTLDLGDNDFRTVSLTSVLGLKQLRALSLAGNPLASLHADPSSVAQHSALTVVDLSRTLLTVFHSEVFSHFPRVQKLNLSFSSVHSIGSAGFRFMPQLTELYMDGAPVKVFPADVFRDLPRLRIVSSHNYKLCCGDILPSTFHGTACYAPRDEISSCEDLVQWWVYQGLLWTMACLSITGNVFCLCARAVVKSMTSSTGFGVFVSNLNMADFLMGVYIAVIGVADERFRGRYLFHEDAWKSSVVCRMAGVVCLLSSEVSALIIWLITLDRFVVLHFPFSTLCFGRTSAAVACLLTWSLAGCLAVLPALPVTSHWEFYSQTGVCIPLPVTRREFRGRGYSFSVLVVFNFVLLLLISAGQAFIYTSVQKNSLKSHSSKLSRDMTIARRLISVAVTDFLCWFPIALCGLLSAAGVPVPGEVNVALAVLVLPVNSAINPFLYTLNTLAEKRRKAEEGRLVKWLESHTVLRC